MKKSFHKILAAVLCAAILISGVTVAGYALSSNEPSVDTTPAPAATAAKTNVPTAQSQTVYIIAGSDGSVSKIIVSDWIKNALVEDGSYTLDDKAQMWSEGDNFYAQRVVEEELPVTMSVSYRLDGQSIDPDDLAGKSGQVTIRFDYTNNQYEYVNIDGQREKIYVPFAMLTGMVLGNDHFTNVSVSNGKVFNDGNRTAVVGIAFPGLQENLSLDRDTLDIPDYVEISADVEDFELAMTMTLATNSVFSEINVDDFDSLDDLSEAADDLTSAMDQLMDGAGQLYDGLDVLLDGANQVSDGVAQLAEGLNTLTANNAALTGGAKQVFDSLLAMANSQIAATGLDLPALTTDNYSAILDGVLIELDENAVIAAARAQVEQAVRAQGSAVRSAVVSAVEQEVTAQVEASVRANVESQVLSALGLDSNALTTPQVQAAVEQQMAGSDAQAAIAANVSAQMESDDVQALITGKTEEQIQLLIDQNMASDEVQAQITDGLAQADAGAAQLQSLKAQLDSYNAFYQGLISYTNGVADAASGANTLNQAMPALLSGVNDLKDGALQLSDGLAELNEEGIQKLADAVNGDLSPMLTRLRATADVSKRYRSFAGLSDDLDGTVKFVYKTDSIQLPEN